MNRLAFALAAALALAVPGEAHAQHGTQMLSVWLVLDPGPVDGVGIGGRYMLPIADGVIRGGRVRDEFTLELGADFVHYADTIGVPPDAFDYSWNGFLVAVGATWNFWLTPRFALYPKLDLGFWFGSYSGWVDAYGYRRNDYGGIYLEPAIGLIVKLGRADLRVEFGTDLARVGLGFDY
ncbi:MAG: hypothetical protein U0229_11820 [Anaeromyxobacter sp.]